MYSNTTTMTTIPITLDVPIRIGEAFTDSDKNQLIHQVQERMTEILMRQLNRPQTPTPKSTPDTTVKQIHPPRSNIRLHRKRGIAYGDLTRIAEAMNLKKFCIQYITPEDNYYETYRKAHPGELECLEAVRKDRLAHIHDFDYIPDIYGICQQVLKDLNIR